MTQSTLQSSRRAFLKTGAAGVMTLGVGGMAQAATTGYGASCHNSQSITEVG